MVVIHRVAEMNTFAISDPGPHPNFRYMEITRIGLSTITYYGEADIYDP
jgi:hypothetical protein